jgi:hypothetical protein
MTGRQESEPIVAERDEESHLGRDRNNATDAKMCGDKVAVHEIATSALCGADRRVHCDAPHNLRGDRGRAEEHANSRGNDELIWSFHETRFAGDV